MSCKLVAWSPRSPANSQVTTSAPPRVLPSDGANGFSVSCHCYVAVGVGGAPTITGLHDGCLSTSAHDVGNRRAIFVGSLAPAACPAKTRVPDWAAALGGGVLLVVVGVLP